jgi:hypothetical protein
MNCEQCELMIFDLPFSAKLATLESALLDHISQCDACNRLLIIHLAGMQQINEERRILPDPFFNDRLLARMKDENRSVKNERTSGKLLQFSPALLSAAAAIILGIWIGGRLTMNIQPVPAVTAESRQLMMDAVAEDLNLKDVSESLLESYLTDNENPAQP